MVSEEVKIQDLFMAALEQGISAWIEYPPLPGFIVKVGYISKEDVLEMNENAKEIIWVKHKKEERTDRKKLTRKWAEKAILDWKGLTLEKLAALLPIKVAEEDKNKEVPCTPENKFALLYYSTDFDIWVTEASTDVENFQSEVAGRKQRLDEVKNS